MYQLFTKRLADLLKRLYRIKRSTMMRQYHRVLPSYELLNDRWEKANYLGYGEGTSIYDSATVFGEVAVGKNTWIGPFTILDGSGRLSIGNNCSISTGVQLYSHDSVKWAVSGGTEKYEYAATEIGNNCYIGPNSIVAKGVKLGNGCIVGANSFVNKSFPDGSKVAGNPARIIE